MARSGYIETPSPLADYALDEEYHRWRVGGGGSHVHFGAKPPKSRVMEALTTRFYRLFYAGRELGAPTYRLPGGIVGRVLERLLWLVRGVLNRSGVMHTRVQWGPDHPLTWSIDDPTRRRVAIVEYGPGSGFLRGDRHAIADHAESEVVTYPGWPSPRFMWDLWRAAGRAEAVYTFFASMHAVPAVIVAKARGRRFVVSVGGYDVAYVPEHGYGLRARWPHRLVPGFVMRRSDRVLAISEAAREEAVAAGAPADRVEVVHLGLPERRVDAPEATPRDPDQVVTIAYVSAVSFSRKGIDRFVAAARNDPGRRYVLVGRVADDVVERLGDPPDNLRITGHVDDDELDRILWSSGVYAQFSWHEGFGASLVEAMQAGCRPVIAPGPAMLEVTGPYAEVTQGSHDDVAAIGRAASTPVDRLAMAAWARDISSIEARGRSLGSALLAPA